jgi:intracellular multiplication protein IcmD
MSETPDLSSVATAVTSNFDNLAQLITASSYVAGLGFSAASILKFKSHKDNPTQIPIGTPAALTAVSAALLYLPSVMTVTGETSFGTGGGATTVTAAQVEAAASAAGVTSSDAQAAKSALESKLSG